MYVFYTHMKLLALQFFFFSSGESHNKKLVCTRQLVRQMKTNPTEKLGASREAAAVVAALHKTNQENQLLFPSFTKLVEYTYVFLK